MYMKNNVDRKLYIKILQENMGKIIMDKLFDKYSEYISYKTLNSFMYENADKTIYIYDPVYSFFDALSDKIINEILPTIKLLYIRLCLHTIKKM